MPDGTQTPEVTNYDIKPSVPAIPEPQKQTLLPDIQSLITRIDTLAKGTETPQQVLQDIAENKQLSSPEKLDTEKDKAIHLLLPAEQSGYFEQTQKKHWGEQAIGSRFTEAQSIQDVLGMAYSQRGNLEGNDLETVTIEGKLQLSPAARERLTARGFNPDHFDPKALAPDARALIVRTPGEVGVLNASGLNPETKVQVVRTKEGVPCSLVVEANHLPVVDYATVIIGPNEKAKPEDPEPSTTEMVWTLHPGAPIPRAEEDYFQEDSTITVEEALRTLQEHGKNPETVFFNVRKTEAEPPLTPERLKELQYLGFEVKGLFPETLTKLNETLGTTMQQRPEGFHLTVISPPESGKLANLSPEQTAKLQAINEAIQKGEGITVTGVGYIDGATAEGIKPADKVKRTSFVTFDIPALQEFRKEIGLPEKYFHVTLGFEGGDIHMREQINPETGKKESILIEKLPNPSLSNLVSPEITFGGITGPERIKTQKTEMGQPRPMQ